MRASAEILDGFGHGRAPPTPQNADEAHLDRGACLIRLRFCGDPGPPSDSSAFGDDLASGRGRSFVFSDPQEPCDDQSASRLSSSRSVFSFGRVFENSPTPSAHSVRMCAAIPIGRALLMTTWPGVHGATLAEARARDSPRPSSAAGARFRTGTSPTATRHAPEHPGADERWGHGPAVTSTDGPVEMWQRITRPARCFAGTERAWCPRSVHVWR